MAELKTKVTKASVLNGPRQNALLAKLGDATHSGGCLYVKRLSDLHAPTLAKVLAGSIKQNRRLEKEKA